MIKSNKFKILKLFIGVAVALLMLGISAVTVFAAGDVSSAIESTWTSAQTQIKNVVNNVIAIVSSALAPTSNICGIALS